MKLDKNGDSEGNFSVIAYMEPENTTVINDFSCPFQFRPVGQFFQKDHDEDSLPVNIIFSHFVKSDIINGCQEY